MPQNNRPVKRASRDRRRGNRPWNGVERRKGGERRSAKGDPTQGGVSPLVKFGFVFLILFMITTINLPDNMVSRLGFESSYIVTALVAIILAGLIAYRNLALIIVVILMVAGANMPKELAELYNIDRDILLAALIALVVIPGIKRWYD